MSAITENLMPNEQILVDTQLHWIIFLWPALISCLLSYFMFKQHIYFALNYAAIAIIAYLLTNVFIQYISTQFILTSARVIKKTGFFSSQTWDIGLSRIEGVRLQQSLLGKMMGFGDLVVSGIGGDQISLAILDQARVFQQQVFQAMEQHKQ
jgi:uncharacterized membrane protein YdbT with pleckstrin-like domain